METQPSPPVSDSAALFPRPKSLLYTLQSVHAFSKNIDMQVHVPGKPGVEEEACLA